MRRYWRVGVALLVVIGLGGCFGGGKEAKEYGKSAQGWYDAIQRSIAGNDLEKADKEYLSLRSEHMGSALLPMTMLALAQAHMANEEYLLANYYLDEFLKQYARGGWAEYARFLKLKASFLGIHDINKDQKLVAETLSHCQSFYASHRGSRYAPLVQTMIVRLEMAQYLLDTDIAGLYDHIGKKEAAEIYREKTKKFIYKPEQIEDPEGGFLSSLNPFH
ncbi:outer membrane protein assembly factor BamD [Nitratifractor sp.]|uniref:outer membrane protein assembly factor BamD n=1 Tax=Nitratifractor sp. TaxID=2268144 RepID=UPI0025F3318C|nr:outer membrane protein assembly factor BamD [Nitratifractor sp.]